MKIVTISDQIEVVNKCLESVEKWTEDRTTLVADCAKLCAVLITLRKVEENSKEQSSPDVVKVTPGYAGGSPKPATPETELKSVPRRLRWKQKQ